MALNSARFIFNLNKISSLGALHQTAKRFASAAATSYRYILTDRKGEEKNIGLITLNRPKALNALDNILATELADAIHAMDKDETIRAIVVTGSEKSFVAGADIKDVMLNSTYSGNVKNGLLEEWSDIIKCKKPLIAAVNGYAFGGGCELALMCDIIYAGDKAMFGQLEVKVGTIPGVGGTQRIARSCGKSKAMEMCLSADIITAQEAEKMGLVSKVFPADQLVAETVKLGERIAQHSPLIVQLCKQAVNVAFETSLQEGLRFERSTFYATFATEDRKEGMSAFTEKRKPNFKNN
ncbi:probable enoyl-CoA hydratase, mitochondrial [Halyomorpha halys]|uniref:probable enoyl-CoA hydratase, mitochondrial n=1 Tax=Halyomorpha halys TaxID=286706 RepID=UPI0006D51361|nr:probable enoyl-CoA hydratase, mitochondrial [Halyomorpha halys]